MRFQSVQILRFVAVLAVVGFHAALGAEHYLGYAPASLAILRYAYVGVDLFFVISGFVIYLVARQGVDTGTFLRRRIERIVPIYWLITLGLFALAYVAPMAFRETSWATLSRLAESLLFVSFAEGRRPIVYVGWTLECEMFFYLFVSAALLMRRPWEMAVVGLSLLAGLGALMPMQAPVAMFLTQPIFVEFAFGIVLGQILLDRRVPVASLVAVAAVLAALLWSGAAPRVLLAGIPSLVLVGLAVWRDGSGRTSQGRIARGAAMLGDASYSIYLAHALAIPLLAKIAVAVWPGWPADLLTAALMIGSIGASLAIYFTAERPLIGFFRGWRRPAKAVVAPA